MNDIRTCIEKPLAHEEKHIKHIEENSNSPDHRETLQAAFYTSKLWPKTTKEIKIQFIDSSEAKNFTVGGRVYNKFDPPQWTDERALKKTGKPVDPLNGKLQGGPAKESVVTVYRERIQPLVPFKLRFVDKGGDVRIAFAGGAGSWSLIGTDHLHAKSNEVTLNYGWLDVPTIIHEFCHVLGMVHEHQNPRGNAIQWNKPAVYAWAKKTQGWNEQTTFNNIIKRYEVGQVNGSDYDSKSIMLYFFDARLTINHKGTEQNTQMSATDVEWIKKTYPGSSIGVDTFMGKMTGGNLSSHHSYKIFNTNTILLVGIVVFSIILIGLFIYVAMKYMNKKGGNGSFQPSIRRLSPSLNSSGINESLINPFARRRERGGERGTSPFNPPVGTNKSSGLSRGMINPFANTRSDINFF